MKMKIVLSVTAFLWLTCPEQETLTVKKRITVKNNRKNVNSLSRSLLLVFLCFPGRAEAQHDPFIPYLQSVPPLVKNISETNSGTGDSAITTIKFLFASRDKINTVYAILARPQHREGKHPAILFLHGGGSKAEDLFRLVQQYASKGYVTLTLDLPGICNNEKAVYSDGPWKARQKGEAPRFDMTGGPGTSTLADAEIAGVEAFNLLYAQPDVDVHYIGITGFSWGGYSTTFLAGLLGKRVKAAYAVFGCGYYEKGSFWKEIIAQMPEADRDTWLTYLDAGRRAPHMKASYFLDAASNDTYFWPEAVGATLNSMTNHKNHVWNPNLNHRQSVHGPVMQQLFFDYYLKKSGVPFGAITITNVNIQPDSSKEVQLMVQLPGGVQKDSVLLYYSEQNTSWQSRTWIPVIATAETNTIYRATIPGEAVKKKINFYAFLLDQRGITSSSMMY